MSASLKKTSLLVTESSQARHIGNGISLPAVPVFQHKSNDIGIMKNNTGLPDNLKVGVENLSGLRMDDVKVHYNSAKPAQMHAHAYARGIDIHIAPRQEKYLPHEAWHVVQQKQGRVKPVLQMKANINDDRHLENEADMMGKKSLIHPFVRNPSLHDTLSINKNISAPWSVSLLKSHIKSDIIISKQLRLKQSPPKFLQNKTIVNRNPVTQLELKSFGKRGARPLILGKKNWDAKQVLYPAIENYNVWCKSKDQLRKINYGLALLQGVENILKNPEITNLKRKEIYLVEIHRERLALTELEGSKIDSSSNSMMATHHQLTLPGMVSEHIFPESTTIGNSNVNAASPSPKEEVPSNIITVKRPKLPVLVHGIDTKYAISAFRAGKLLSGNSRQRSAIQANNVAKGGADGNPKPRSPIRANDVAKGGADYVYFRAVGINHKCWNAKGYGVGTSVKGKCQIILKTAILESAKSWRFSALDNFGSLPEKEANTERLESFLKSKEKIECNEVLVKNEVLLRDNVYGIYCLDKSDAILLKRSLRKNYPQIEIIYGQDIFGKNKLLADVMKKLM